MASFKYDIESGTHKEVFVFPDLYTIAVNYENLREVIADDITGANGYLLGPDEQISIQGTYFSSSAFFFDYKAAAREAFDQFLWKTGLAEYKEWEPSTHRFADPEKFLKATKGKYRPVGKVYYGAMKPNRKGNTYQLNENFSSLWNEGSVPFSEKDWAPSYKWYMIFYAWKEWLRATKGFPGISVLPDFHNQVYQRLVGNFNVGGTRQYLYQSGNRAFFSFGERDNNNPWRKWHEEYQRMNDYDKLNFIHPLVHFPPLDYSSLLHDTIFYGPDMPPKERNAKYQEMREYYGALVADGVKSNYSNKNITYGDLIRPRGYNFDINLNPIGINSAYPLNYDNFSYNFKTLAKMPYTPGSQTRVTAGVQEEIFNALYWPPPHIAANKSFGSRDWTIMGWLGGRLIPPDLKWLAVIRDSGYNPWSYPGRLSYTSACGFQGMGRELCTGVGSKEPFMLRGLPPNDIYPTGELQFIAADVDPFRFIQEIITLAVSVTVAVTTGNVAPLMKAAADVLVQVTTAISADAGKYAGLVIPILSGVLIKKYGTTPEGIGSAAKAISSLSSPIISGWSSRLIEDFKNDNVEMIEQISKKVSDRTISIFEAISERTIPGLVGIENQITSLQMAPGSVIEKQSTAGQAMMMFNLIEKSKKTNWLLWGSIGVGAAILLNYLKKK